MPSTDSGVPGEGQVVAPVTAWVRTGGEFPGATRDMTIRLPVVRRKGRAAEGPDPFFQHTTVFAHVNPLST